MITVLYDNEMLHPIIWIFLPKVVLLTIPPIPPQYDAASMIIECCSQERSYRKFFGLLGQVMTHVTLPQWLSTLCRGSVNLILTMWNNMWSCFRNMWVAVQWSLYWGMVFCCLFMVSCSVYRGLRNACNCESSMCIRSEIKIDSLGYYNI